MVKAISSSFLKAEDPSNLKSASTQREYSDKLEEELFDLDIDEPVGSINFNTRGALVRSPSPYLFRADANCFSTEARAMFKL